MTRPRRVRIIVNPIAGSGTAPARARRVRDALAAAGCDAESVTTDAAGHAARLARDAVADSADVVLVCGGDGTVNEAVQGLAGTHTALAVMPLGTANVLGHELGLGRSARRVTDLVLRGRRRRLDLGLGDGRFFICMASVGFDAWVTEHMARWRRGGINYLSYLRPTWRAFWDYPFEPLDVRVDGVPLKRPVRHIVVGNVRSYGGPFMMTPAARPDDGLLDACVFEAAGRAALVFYMAAAAVHVHHRFRGASCLRGRKIEVGCARPVAMQMDGDFKGHAPVTFEAAPGAITVLSAR